jgi:peroxiredoxin
MNSSRQSRLATIISALCVFAIVAFAQNANAFTMQDAKGNTINFSQFKGKWLIINYWASWCKPCYKEVPELNAFYLQHKNKNTVVLGVSYDRVQGSRLRAAIKRMGIKYPTLVGDPARKLGLGNIPGLPATFIFAPNGQLKARLLGLQTKASIQRAMRAG